MGINYVSGRDHDMIILKRKQSCELPADKLMAEVLCRLPHATARVTWHGPTQEIVIVDENPDTSADYVIGMLFPALDDMLTPKIIVRGVNWHREQLAQAEAANG